MRMTTGEKSAVSGYLDMDLLRFTTAGSVDDGKSTLIGRLLYDSKAIFKDQLEAIEKTSEQASVDLSLTIKDKIKSLSSEPPVNIQLVNEIRQKVSEGRYPIDLNAISSKMFESIKNG